MEFPKPEGAPTEHLRNELSTMIVGTVIRLTHKTDPYVWKNTRRSPLDHRIAHIRRCERCRGMLKTAHLEIEMLFDELVRAG